MAIDFKDADSEYIHITEALKDGMPFSVFFWCRIKDLAVDQTMFIISQFGIANTWQRVAFEAATDAVMATSNDDDAAERFAKSAAISVDTWHAVGATFDRVAERAIFLDGVKTVAGGESDPKLLDRTTVGARAQNSAHDEFVDGSIARLAVWDVTLTDAQMVDLARGLHPLRVRGDVLLDYYEFVQGDFREDWIRVKDFVVGGGTPATRVNDFGPYFWCPSPYVYRPPPPAPPATAPYYFQKMGRG